MLFNLISLSAFIASAQAVGRAIVTNQCGSPIYLWSVGGSIGPKVVLGTDQSYSEAFRRDPVSGGIAIKISSLDDGIFKPNVSQTIFAYNLDGSQIWYDMSSVFGDGFSGSRVTLTPSDSTCQPISWPFGYPPAGSQIKNCQAETNLELSFCTGHCLPSWSKFTLPRQLGQFIDVSSRPLRQRCTRR